MMQTTKKFIFLLGFSSLFLNISLNAQTESLSNTRPHLSDVAPVALDWRSIPWPNLEYERKPLAGGAALYTLPDKNVLTFELDFVFSGGVYSFSRAQRQTFTAFMELLMLGGTAKYSYEELSRYTLENGLSLNTALVGPGKFSLTASALTVDFDKIIALLEEVLLKPRWAENALDIWKEDVRNNFQNFIQGNQLGQQMTIARMESRKKALGPDHYLSTFIERMEPKLNDLVTYSDVKDLAQKIITKQGLNIVLSGSYPQKAEHQIAALVAKMKTSEPLVQTWSPGRIQEETKKDKIQTVIISKPDMTQNVISLAYYFPYTGKLNSVEKAKLMIALDVFSSTIGAVGIDRFAKALRVDSGICYSPWASFNADILFPDYKSSAFEMSFQSPNDRLKEAVVLAQSTYKKFMEKGILAAEFQRSKIGLQNQMLSQEVTIFDKVTEFINTLSISELPAINSTTQTLVVLENQKSLEEINKTLTWIASTPAIPVLVILGNPTEKNIQELKTLPYLDGDFILKDYGKMFE